SSTTASSPCVTVVRSFITVRERSARAPTAGAPRGQTAAPSLILTPCHAARLRSTGIAAGRRIVAALASRKRHGPGGGRGDVGAPRSSPGGAGSEPLLSRAAPKG